MAARRAEVTARCGVRGDGGDVGVVAERPRRVQSQPDAAEREIDAGAQRNAGVRTDARLRRKAGDAQPRDRRHQAGAALSTPAPASP